LVWQSYYLLEETFRYEKPQAVIFSVLAIKYGEPQSEAYNRITLDGMRLSAEKVASINASMTEGENLLSYLFPLFRYHARWRELSYEDLRYMFTRRGVSHNGYLLRCDVKPLAMLPTPPRLSDYTLSGNAWAYLDRMRELCERNGADLILLKAPIPYPHWYPQWDEQVADYANEHGLLYINAWNDLDEIGLDFTTDTYDGGLHLNLYGAEKLTHYLGGILHERGLPDMRSHRELSAEWAEKARAYTAHIDIQLAEIAETGMVSTLTRE